jgi:uncharacterized membrane protein YidH (DUF202 family)
MPWYKILFIVGLALILLGIALFFLGFGCVGWCGDSSSGASSALFPFQLFFIGIVCILIATPFYVVALLRRMRE